MNRQLPPPDEAAHEDGRLMHEVTVVNALLGRYVLRHLDADAGWTEPISAVDERALAEQVAEVADELRARAARREQGGHPPPLIVDAVDEERP